MDQNSHNNVLINYSKIAWPTKILMPFLNSLDNLLLDAISFFIKVLIFFKYCTKHANFWLGGGGWCNVFPANISSFTYHVIISHSHTPYCHWNVYKLVKLTMFITLEKKNRDFFVLRSGKVKRMIPKHAVEICVLLKIKVHGSMQSYIGI